MGDGPWTPASEARRFPGSRNRMRQIVRKSRAASTDRSPTWPSARACRSHAMAGASGAGWFVTTNPELAQRALIEADRNSSSYADFPRGSLDTTRCSDMLDRSESIGFSGFFGSSPNRVLPSRASGGTVEAASGEQGSAVERQTRRLEGSRRCPPACPSRGGGAEVSRVRIGSLAAHGLQPTSISGFLER